MDLSLRTIYRHRGLLIQYAKEIEDYSAIWDEFWLLSKEVRVYIDYYDPDTSYEEDIMARYNAIGNYLGEMCDMSNDVVGKMREDGYYLVRHFEDGGLSIEEVSNGKLYCNGEYYSFSGIHVHWISEYPLNLDDVAKVHIAGGSDKMIEGIIDHYLDAFS